MIYDKQNECMDRSGLEALQGERLVALVRRVYENNTAYRSKMDEAHVQPSDIKSIGDITKLPFTVKQDLRDNYPFGMLSVPKRDIVRLHASSGTTGKLTVVCYTKNDIDMWSDMGARCIGMTGATPDDIVQVAYGYGLFTGGLGIHYGSERFGSLTVPCSAGNTSKQLHLMKDFETTLVACTPSYAIYLSENLEKESMSVDDLSLKYGIFGAEPWSNEMRREIERRLHIKAYDIYGLSEIMGPGVAMECECQNGLHINEDHFFPEIVDPNTLEPVEDGTYGELVITTLTKEGMPLVRYRTRDITKITHEPCACGRTLARIDRIQGRSDDMLIIRGVNVFPSQIESVLMSVGDAVLPHYQIIVDRKGALDTFEIEVEINDKLFSDEVKKIQELQHTLEREMLANLSVQPKITLVSPNTIERTSGKAKRIIDKRKK